MKLYYYPAACSLGAHIVARALGLDIELVRIARESRADFVAINPKGYVPALQLDDGAVLTEGPIILQYLADREPAAGLVPPFGTLERYRVEEMLAYIACELHKAHAPLFRPATPEATRAECKQELAKRYAIIEAALSKSDYLVGDRFTIADAYLFPIVGWASLLEVDLAAFPAIRAWHERIAARPEVIAARAAEAA